MLIIAVHGGAGNHSLNKDLEAQTKQGLKEACVCAQKTFKAQQDVCLAVRDSIVVLEDDPRFNAGTGSNLTINGGVECDASIMNAAEDFGAVGAVTGIKNPITSAYDVLAKSQVVDPHGRIPPMVLARRSLSTPPELVDPSMMITSKALSEWKRLKEMIELGQATRPPNGDSIIQDTVGAIACTVDGDVSAGVSSGGILLKRSGRVGEAGTFGAGCWASGARGGLNAVACSISGAGEMIMRAFLAKELSEAVRKPNCDVHKEIELSLTKFKDMCAQRRCEHTSAGVILIVTELQTDGLLKSRLWCGFTTASFAIAYAASADSTPKATILRRPNQYGNKAGLYITSLPI
ncbi:hypothetical protein FRC12_021775 [Ceratobasidium sp. 428]|nr:hypothetical protein FRC12_021775 [Ceratobasidium sp. 428]